MDWNFILEITPMLLSAMRITLFATVVGMLIALVLGLVWAILRMLPFPFIKYPVTAVVEFIRSTPLLVQLYFAFYILPDFGISLPALWIGVGMLGLHYSAYTAEVYRAGLESVPNGQWEACRALNLPPGVAFTRIILPQALPPVLPALGNYAIAMFKETPLLSAITVVEMLNTAKNIGSEHFRYLEPVTIVGILFLLVSISASWGVGRIERSMNLESRSI
jgi:polar amino acid transport system permease protein